MHYYCTIDKIRHATSKPFNHELKSYHNCDNENELNVKSYGDKGLEIGASVYFAFNNEKYEGIIDAIIQYSRHSDRVFIGVTFDKNMPTENQMYSIFQFDNKLFLEPYQVKIKKNSQVKTLNLKKKEGQLEVNFIYFVFLYSF